jgi:hypothetical protein
VDWNWRFAKPENLAVITTRQIVSEGQPILHVTHDSDDGGWQFLGSGDANPDDAMVVALRTIVGLDPSVQELADLPLGWHAWRRSVRDSWQRSRH